MKDGGFMDTWGTGLYQRGEVAGVGMSSLRYTGGRDISLDRASVAIQPEISILPSKSNCPDRRQRGLALKVVNNIASKGNHKMFPL